MERGSIIVISIIIVAVIAALIIAYYQSTSTKVVAAQCDKTKKICQVQSETTHFGGYFPVYSYYYVPFPLYGPGLGIFYPGLIFTPSVCSSCLTKITPQDEQDVLTSKAPVSQSDLFSEQSSPQSENPNPSEPTTPSKQSSPSKNPPSSESSPSPGSEGGAGGGGGGSEGGAGGGGGGSEGGTGGGGGGDE
jgi:uncharacterized membrane protein YgcG